MTAKDGATAVANARSWTRYDTGMCLKFIRGEAWEIGSLYGSAVDAWAGAMHKHPGDRNPPLSAPMFYSGGQYGHIVINTGPGYMRSTDCPSSGRVSDAETAWPEYAWGQTYLGWTEDLNGVRLPLGEDEMNQEDWERLRQIVRDEVWERKLDVDKPDGSGTKKAAGQMLREILQRVQKG